MLTQSMVPEQVSDQKGFFLLIHLLDLCGSVLLIYIVCLCKTSWDNIVTNWHFYGIKLISIKYALCTAHCLLTPLTDYTMCPWPHMSSNKITVASSATLVNEGVEDESVVCVEVESGLCVCSCVRTCECASVRVCVHAYGARAWKLEIAPQH